MRRAVRAEWTKLRSTPAPAWLLPATVVLFVATAAAVPARLALSGVYLGQVPVAVLGVLAVGSEYGTGLIVATLTALPGRWAVAAAKALVPAVAVAATGVVAVLGALLVAGAAHRAADADGAVLLPAGAVVVAHLVLVALLGLGIAAIVRDSATAAGVVLGLLYLPPVLIPAVADARLHRLLERLAPMQLPIGSWAGLGVLAAWSSGALLAGVLLFRSRDA